MWEGSRCFVVLFTQSLPLQVDLVRLCSIIHEEGLAEIHAEQLSLHPVVRFSVELRFRLTNMGAHCTFGRQLERELYMLITNSPC